MVFIGCFFLFGGCMQEQSIVWLMRKKYNNDKINEMVAYLVANIDKSITWTPQEACLQFNMDMVNKTNHSINLQDWNLLFDDNDINAYFLNETIKQKRITIRKIINKLDDNKKLSPQEIKAIETLNEMINNANSNENKIRYVAYNTQHRFDEFEDNFIMETTWKPDENKTPQ